MIKSGRIAILGAALLLGTAGTALAAGDTLYLDSHDTGTKGFSGPVTSTFPLTAGQQYVITVSGTSSAYQDQLWDQRPTCQNAAFPAEDLPMFYSPGVNHYKVGQDAAFFFARPRKWGDRFCPALPKRISTFQMQLSTASGFAPAAPDGNPTAPNSEHVYHFTVTGQGEPVSFRMADTNTKDNYGEYEILVPPTPSSNTSNSGNTGGGGTFTAPSTQPKPKLLVWTRNLSFQTKPPPLVAAGSSLVNCGVSFGTLQSCVIHLRTVQRTKVLHPTGTLPLGALLAERAATSIGRPFVRMHMRLTLAGRHALRSRPLGMDVIALAVGGGTAADSAIGAFHLLAGPRFTLPLSTRSSKLPTKTLGQLDKVAKLLAGAKTVRCTGHTSGGTTSRDLIVSARQAAAACARIKAAGFAGTTTSHGSGHAAPARRRIVINFTY